MPDFEMSPSSHQIQPDPPYFDADDSPDESPEDSPEERPVRAREGLPKAYRMRHTPHYVEQLMGDAPLQSVRRIPIAEIDRIDRDQRGPSAGADVTQLITSIREVGVLQPLLVAPAEGSRFQLLSG